ncbi:MAG: hypothetical protein KF819_23740 [Labilithrix sp.]|nr:hypothetical protein [Labilithrix sp.]
MSHLDVALLALGALALAGCGGTTLQITSCPNPVLLGPVDRVGGHRAERAASRGHVSVEAEDWMTASTETKGRVTTATVSGASDKAEGAGLMLLAKTEGRKDRDVRVAKLPVGAWAWILTTGAGTSSWAGLEADVVEVRRDR